MAKHDDLVVVIGGGASGITIAHTLKHRIGHSNFVILERTGSLGGTWSEEVNNYPGEVLSIFRPPLASKIKTDILFGITGCGVDIPSHFYSFSYNQNPDWSHVFCRHDELTQYMNDTVDKFHLRSHFQTRTEVEACDWIEEESVWQVKVLRLETGQRETLRARIVVSAVGALSVPKEMDIEGLDSFQGRYWHSARWDKSYDWRNKRIGIIGNGCSATQIVPEMLHDGVGSVVQFGRSAQWFMPRNDPAISSTWQFIFRYVPFALALQRLWLFYRVDAESLTLEMTPRARAFAHRVELAAIDHIRTTAPEKWHESLIPKDILGCKRRVMDGTNKGSYLASLHDPKLTLVPQRAVKVTEDAVVSKEGTEYKVDALCFATGYKVTEYLIPMKIRGRKGQLLESLWEKDEGAHAFNTISVSGFPNLALMFGPNSVPSNNSVIFKAETQAEYIARILFKPLLKERSCASLDVKRDVEVAWYTALRHTLTQRVWATGCVNWYLNKWGHNTSTFPACGLAFRRSFLTTSLTANYNVQLPNFKWRLYRLLDLILYWPWAYTIAFFCSLGEKLERAFPLL